MGCSVVTKPGFAFCDVGEVTAKYLGRTQITLSLLELSELKFLIHSEDKMKILWVKSPTSPAAITALDAAQDVAGCLGCELTVAAFYPQIPPSSPPGLLSIQALPSLNPWLGCPHSVAVPEVYMGPSLKPAKVPLNVIDVYVNRGVIPCQTGSNRI